MTPRLPRFTARELIRILKDDGFVLHSSRGSHHHYIHSHKNIKVTIPVHAGKVIGPGLLKSILKQAQIDWADY